MIYCMDMAHVIVLGGGTSSERAVSLRSASAVAAALQTAGHTVTFIDPSENFLRQKSAVKKADVVFPALHGTGGEDGTLQSILDKWSVAYVGAGADSSSLCFDKASYKALLAAHSISTAPGALVSIDLLWNMPLSEHPFVLKPVDGGSSIDTHIIRDPVHADRQAIAESLSRHQTMLMEKLISGTEITVAVIGKHALPVVEIIPPTDGEFDYENKYNGKTQELCPPLHVTEAVQRKAQRLAEKIHKICGCRDLSRTDFIVTPEGKPVPLETNTLPGMTNESLVPKAALAEGTSMPQLCDRLVQLALQRKNAKQ